MVDLSQARLTTLAVHKVGNKVKEQGVVASKELFTMDEDLSLVLQDYFLKPFRTDEFYKLSHPTDLNLNEVFNYSRGIFLESNEEFLSHSVNILNHLYAQSTHPHIKSGELYVAHFRECVVDGADLEAVGIFKSENKDIFLHFGEKDESVTMNLEEGVSLKKLDKGCLIFKTFEDDGYSVLMVDKGSEDAVYWRDDFLQVTRIQDTRYQTEQFLHLTKDYCDEVLAKEEDRKDQLMFLNKSLNYFSKHKELDLEEFKDSVFTDSPEQKVIFEDYRISYEEDKGLPASDDGFPISRYGVNNMKKEFKSLIKLDTQMEIKLNHRKIEQSEEHLELGYDEIRKMHYYKVYFNEELE